MRAGQLPGRARTVLAFTTLALASPYLLPLGCASDEGARKAPATDDDTTPAAPAKAKQTEEYEQLIETAVTMTRDIREGWQRGEPRDIELETQALKLYLRATDLDPARVEGPYGAAVMLVAACQADGDACTTVCPPALSLLDRADAIESGYRYSTWNRGVCLEGTGRFAEALQAAELSLVEYPDDPDMWALRAKVRIRLGYLDGACEDLVRMFDLMGVSDDVEQRIEPYGCRVIEGVPRFVPTEEPGIRL